MKKLFFILFFIASILSVFIYSFYSKEALSEHRTVENISIQEEGHAPSSETNVTKTVTQQTLVEKMEQTCSQNQLPKKEVLDFLENTLQVPGIEEFVLWKNFHLLTPEGNKIIVRVHSESDKDSGSERKVFQLFELDETGFPWPKKSTDEERFYTSEKLEAYLKDNRLQNSQEVTQLTSSDFEVTYEKEGNEIKNFQWNDPTKHIECHIKSDLLECRCDRL